MARARKQMSDDVIGLFLEVEANLDPALQAARKSYGKFISEIESLNEKAKKSVKGGLDALSHLLGAFSNATGGRRAGGGSGGGGGFSAGSGSSFSPPGGGPVGIGATFNRIGQSGPMNGTQAWQSMGWGKSALPAGMADSVAQVLNEMYRTQEALKGAKLGASGGKPELVKAVAELDKAMKELQKTTQSYDTKALKPLLDDLQELGKEYANVKADILELNNIQKSSFGGAASVFGKATAISGAINGIASAAGFGTGDMQSDNISLSEYGRKARLNSRDVQDVYGKLLDMDKNGGITPIGGPKLIAALNARQSLTPNAADNLGEVIRIGQISQSQNRSVGGVANDARLLMDQSHYNLDQFTGAEETNLRLSQNTGYSAESLSQYTIQNPGLQNAIGDSNPQAQALARLNFGKFLSASYRGGFGELAEAVVRGAEGLMLSKNGYDSAAVSLIRTATGMDWREFNRRAISDPNFAETMLGRMKQVAGRSHGDAAQIMSSQGFGPSSGSIRNVQRTEMQQKALDSIKGFSGISEGGATEALKGDVGNSMDELTMTINAKRDAVAAFIGPEAREAAPTALYELDFINQIVGSVAEIAKGVAIIKAAKWLFGAEAAALTFPAACGAIGGAIGTALGWTTFVAESTGALAAISAGVVALPAALGLVIGGAIAYELYKHVHDADGVPQAANPNALTPNNYGPPRGDGYLGYQFPGNMAVPLPSGLMQGVPIPTTQPSSMVPSSLMGSPDSGQLAAVMNGEVADPTTHGLLRELIAAITNKQGGPVPHAGQGVAAPPDQYFTNLMSGAVG